MDIGGAVRAMKEGKRVTRPGWNGRGMWLALTPGTTPRARHNADTAQGPSGPMGCEERGAAPRDASAVITRLRGDLERAENAMQDAANTLIETARSILPHIDMRNARGEVVVGWLASQEDLLAEDWQIVE